MNWEQVLELVWKALNTPVGVALVAGVALWLINKLYSAKPAWAAFEGAIVSAIRYAEKAVSDETSNKGLARFDAALKYVLKVYEEVERKRPSRKVEASLKEGIRLMHNEMEAAGVLE